MPYKGADDDQKNLIEFARGGRPNLADVDGFGGPRPTKLHTLKPPPAQVPSLRDECLEMLKVLTVEIESGKVSPSHLIIGFGQTTENGAMSYWWDAAGLNMFEVMGHLQVYAAKLADGEGE
jgi:hypothetical protein